jgi:hypothetical protein
MARTAALASSLVDISLERREGPGHVTKCCFNAGLIGTGKLGFEKQRNVHGVGEVKFENCLEAVTGNLTRYPAPVLGTVSL